MALPNFDHVVFESITGIHVGVKSLKGKKVTVKFDDVEYTATID